jgi:Tfp pilus assembly protein PilF
LIVSPIGAYTFVDETSWFESIPKEKSEFYTPLWNRHWHTAMQEATSYLALHPFDLDALHALALSHFQTSSWEKSRYYVDLMLSLDPKHSGALNVLGLILQKQAIHLQDYKEADYYFEESWRHSQKEIAAGLNRGFLRLSMGDLHTAQEIFHHTTLRCVDCAPAYLGLGMTYSRLKQWGQAATAFTRAKTLDPTNPQVLLQWGLLLRKQSKFQKSNEHLEAFLSHPSHGDAPTLEKVRALIRLNEQAM